MELNEASDEVSRLAREWAEGRIELSRYRHQRTLLLRALSGDATAEQHWRDLLSPTDPQGSVSRGQETNPAIMVTTDDGVTLFQPLAASDASVNTVEASGESISMAALLAMLAIGGVLLAGLVIMAVKLLR